MSDFKREERYIVLKLKKLSLQDAAKIRHNIFVNGWEKALTECVVVESDWPIYDDVWGMVEKLAETNQAADTKPQS